MTPSDLPPGAGNVAGVLARILMTLQSIEGLLRGQYVQRPEPMARVVGMPNGGRPLAVVASIAPPPPALPATETNGASRSKGSAGALRRHHVVNPAGPRTARRMKELRRRLALTQAELGTGLGVSVGMIGLIETGRCGITRRVDEAMRRVGGGA